MTQLHLIGMAALKTSSLPPWESEWVLFGPIPNEGSSSTWPGKVGFAPLPLDGALQIPTEAEILGQQFPAQPAFSRGGQFDFTTIFPERAGCPIVYLLTTVESPLAGELPVSYGACWGAQWWVNGQLVYESRTGNFGDPTQVTSHQFLAPVKPGTNVIVVKVIAGTADEWSLCMSHLAPRPVPSSTAATTATAKPTRRKPADRTRDYVHTGLRIEERPGPVPVSLSRMRERVMAAHGVQAHWIGIVDPTGSPYAESAILPPGAHFKPGHAEQLCRQVEAIHRNGMSAVTWYPAMMSKSTAAAHPEWRVVPFPAATSRGAVDVAAMAQDHAGFHLCHNTPYGEALIQFTLESLGKYDLDGFWFDGTVLSPDRVLTCVCGDCQLRFREAEGLATPAAPDWNNPVFRRWVQWRFRDYMEFWGRLADRVKRQYPRARIMVNHLHRLCHGWTSGIPLAPYAADIVAGTESQDDPFISAFHARLQRAYGKPETEVWMGLHKLFTRNENWAAGTDPLYRYLHHGLSTMTAGAMPSFGTPDPGEKLGAAYQQLALQLNPRRSYVAGTATVPYAALLLSGQAETFHFSRRPDWGFPKDYWYTVFGWHNLLLENQLPQELIFDDQLEASRINAWPVLILPFAVALSSAQLRGLEEYVRAGGILITDPYLGAGDEWGEAAARDLRQTLLGELAAPAPAPSADLRSAAAAVTIRQLGAGQVLILAGNPGLRFHQERSRCLAEELGGVLKRLAPPPVEIAGPPRLHLGLFRTPGRWLLHLQNFMAWSGAEAFPNPVLAPPEPATQVCVTVRNLPVTAAVAVLEKGAPELVLERHGADVTFTIPEILWGTVIEIKF